MIDIEKDLQDFIKNRGEDKNSVAIKDLKNHVGETLNVTGSVVKQYENNGNIFFTLKDTSGDITCVLFAKTNRENKNYYKHISNSLKNKSQLTLKGTVATYKGKIELKVWQVHE